MNYELAKKLKDARFPQVYILGQWACKHGLDRLMENSCDCYGDMLFYAPSLCELIEACGIRFKQLIQRSIGINPFWEAYTLDGERTNGSTPEEAVAKLWLELNK